MRIGVVVRPLNDANLRLAAQIGADEVCAGISHDFGRVWSPEEITGLKRRIEGFGLRWRVVETLPVSDAIKLGLEGRDAEIDALRETIRNLGAAGLDTAVYTWTAVFSWLRTDLAVPVRGGGLATGYDHAAMQGRPPSNVTVREDRLWETLEYFLRAIVPVAEDAGVKLALHPDDPPLSPVRGVGRIMISPENSQRALDLVPSEINGMTLCQGCFSEMGVDVPREIARFTGQGRVNFAHFRNLRGTGQRFTEQFHDDGDVDMAAIMRAFLDAGYTGAMRPDHVPLMEGDGSEDPGYTMTGRLFAVGYMRGLMHALRGDRR